MKSKSIAILLLFVLALGIFSVTPAAATAPLQQIDCYPFEFGEVCINAKISTYTPINTSIPTTFTATLTNTPQPTNTNTPIATSSPTETATLSLTPTLSSLWVEGSIFGVVANSPAQNLAIFVNTYTGVGPANGLWVTIDLSDLVPTDTKAVYLSGILIITHGTTSETCDLTMAYRAYGETDTYNYIAQTVETAIGGGQRSNHSVWVPIRDGKFEILWNRSTSGQWPDHCSYGINMKANAYMR